MDRYEAKVKIGEGGMQKVYLAADKTFDREVVLKIPKNESAKKRFKASAVLSAQVNHPNIARTLDYFEEEGSGHLIEEFVPGIDLGNWLISYANLIDPHLAAHVLHHLVKGLAAMHHVGVIHRDLKPSNILVSDDLRLSRIKITDFGIAKMAEETLDVDIDKEDTLTTSSTVVGALPFMSPELITKEDSDVNTATDIWSLGAILYRLVAGVPPFGHGPKAVYGILKGQPPEPPKYILEKINFQPIGRAIWEIILDCLKSDANKRPTADELVKRCSGLCYLDMGRQVGRVYNYGIRHGAWGFINSNDGEDIFLHSTNFFGSKPTNGMKVAYVGFPGNPDSRAFPVFEMIDKSE